MSNTLCNIVIDVFQKLFEGSPEEKDIVISSFVNDILLQCQVDSGNFKLDAIRNYFRIISLNLTISFTECAISCENFSAQKYGRNLNQIETTIMRLVDGYFNHSAVHNEFVEKDSKNHENIVLTKCELQKSHSS